MPARPVRGCPKAPAGTRPVPSPSFPVASNRPEGAGAGPRASHHAPEGPRTAPARPRSRPDEARGARRSLEEARARLEQRGRGCAPGSHTARTGSSWALGCSSRVKRGWGQVRHRFVAGSGRDRACAGAFGWRLGAVLAGNGAVRGVPARSCREHAANEQAPRRNEVGTRPKHADTSTANVHVSACTVRVVRAPTWRPARCVLEHVSRRERHRGAVHQRCSENGRVSRHAEQAVAWNGEAHRRGLEPHAMGAKVARMNPS